MIIPQSIATQSLCILQGFFLSSWQLKFAFNICFNQQQISVYVGLFIGTILDYVLNRENLFIGFLVLAYQKVQAGSFFLSLRMHIVGDCDQESFE